MNESHELSLLVRLSEVISFAEYLPIERIAERNPKPEYPETIGEHLVNYSLNLVMRHDWVNEKNERIVEPMLDALNQLDTGVDRPEVWRELFDDNKRLRSYLGIKR